MPKRRAARADFDTPWKEALQHFLGPFLAFFFPDIHAGIAWARGYEALDKELHQIVRAPRGRALADKLFKVWRTDGRETWLLIHVEVQGEPEAGFPKRMFDYNTRAYHRYNGPVVSLAVLTDERSDWRPDRFEYGAWGSSTSLCFPTAKLIDWRGREGELAASTNPFAQVVLAHLHALATRRDAENRYRYKLDLVKGLYERGWNAEDVRQLFRIIDWLLDLPDELKPDFNDDLHAWEEEKRMPYITSVEQMALERGMEKGRKEGLAVGLFEGIEAALMLKFGKSATRLMPRVRLIEGTDNLRALLHAIPSAENLQVIRERLPQRR